MRCGDLMNTDIEWIPGSASVQEAAQRMRDLSLGFLLVSDPVPDQAAGVITDRDVAVRVCAEGLDPRSTRVGQVATIGLVACSQDQDLSAAEQLMGETQKSRLVVTSASGEVVGVLSLTDILRGDGARRAVRTANAVLARDADGPHAPLESIHLTPSTVEDEDEAANRDHLVVGGGHRGSMKEFPG